MREAIDVGFKSTAEREEGRRLATASACIFFRLKKSAEMSSTSAKRCAGTRKLHVGGGWVLVPGQRGLSLGAYQCRLEKKRVAAGVRVFRN